MATFSFGTPSSFIDTSKLKKSPLAPKPGGQTASLFRSIAGAFSRSSERGRKLLEEQAANRKPTQPLVSSTGGFGLSLGDGRVNVSTPDISVNRPSNANVPPIVPPLDLTKLSQDQDARRRAELIAGRGTAPATRGMPITAPTLPITPTSDVARTPSGLTLNEALAQRTAPIAPTTPVTDFAQERTKSNRDKLVDLLLERATKPFDIEGTFKTLREEAGIPGLESTKQKFVEDISRVEDLLSNLEKDITERVGGFKVTEPQRRRLLASEREPLSRQLGIAERGLRTTEAAIEPKEKFVSDLLGFKQTARKEQLDALTQAIQLRDKDRASIISLASAYPEADISTSDDIETALSKAQPYITEKRELDREKQFAEIEKIYGSIESPRKQELELQKLESEIVKNRASAAASIARASQTGRGRPLPAAQSQLFASTNAIQEGLTDLERLLDEGVGTGPLSGTLGAIGRFTGLGSNAKFNFQVVSKRIADDILRAKSGAQTGEKELDRMSAFLPTLFTQEGVNRTAIVEMRKSLRRFVDLNAQILSETGYNVPVVATGQVNDSFLEEAEFEEE